MQTGTLIVRVYTSQAQIPMVGATVVVAARGAEGKWELLSLQITDSSGTVRPIAIAAPETEESITPNPAGAPAPFALCDIWVEHPRYALTRMEGVQIFPGVETVQNIELIPLARGACSLQQRDVRETAPQEL